MAKHTPQADDDELRTTPPADKADTAESEERREARDAVRRLTEDDDDFSLRAIIGGDIWKSRLFTRQVVFVVFVVILMLLHTGNRYAAQDELIVIDSLKVELQKAHYNVLTQSSELTNLTRQSVVEARLLALGDTTLLTTRTPPYELTAEGGRPATAPEPSPQPIEE